MANFNPYESPPSAEQIEGKDLRRNLTPDEADSRVIRFAFRSVAFLILFPGLIFGSLILLFAPVNILAGRATWLAALPVGYGLFQLTSLFVWYRPAARLGGIGFGPWAAATIVSSVLLIAEQQRQINIHDHACGNALLGAVFLQMLACGTVVGMSLLFLDYRRPRSLVGGLWRASGSTPPQKVMLDYCSICRCEVQIDGDDRCLICRWPV